MAPRRRKRGGGGLTEAVAPSLTSLMDVVTIILVYFVKTFAVSPLSVQDPSVQLPISTSQEAPEDAVVVMITGSERRDTTPTGQKVLIPAVPTIVVDDQVILQLGSDFLVPTGQLEGQYVIRALKQKLLEVRKMQGVTAELTDGAGFNGKVIIVSDGSVPYETLSKVMISCAGAGFDGFKFATVKDEG